MVEPGSHNSLSVSLDGEWSWATSPDGPWLTAQVPGTWWTTGIDQPGPIRHRREVEVSAQMAALHQELIFEGSDYDTTVIVDGIEVGRHIGGFAPFRVPVKLAAGTHALDVIVDCPVEEFGTVWPHAKTTLRGVFGHHDARPGGWTERGQEQSSGGIWGSVALCGSGDVVIEHVGTAFSISGADAIAKMDICVVNRAAPTRVTVRCVLIAVGDPADRHELWTDTWLPSGTSNVSITGRLASPRLWWTWDHGRPDRYELTVSVDQVDAWGDRDRTQLARDTHLVGIREITVDDGWQWHLNGRPIFIRGCNYIGHQWLSELDRSRAFGDVRLAVEANINLLRIHAHVTTPDVYDACDEFGVLVWQDLPMQWGYADSATTYDTARRMVAELIDLHGWRPSVAFWCAHNEAPWNEPWMAEEAGQLVPDQNQRLDHELAALFRELDPSRPSLANSGAGDGHTYPGWYWGKWTDAAELLGGAFVSEYGAQAIPSRPSLDKILDPTTATMEDWSFAGFQHHEHHVNVGVTVLTTPIEELIDRSQHYQARQLQFATEVYRRRKRERINGVITFMLVDPWPCISWSVLDHWREPKPGYEALRRAMQPVLASIETENDTFRPDERPSFGLWWINDLHTPLVDATLRWWVSAVSPSDTSTAPVSTSKVIAEGEVSAQIHADAARRVAQTGPLDLNVGRYLIGAEIATIDGSTVGTNEWRFSISDKAGEDQR